jgi:hypothetical protein
MPERVEAVSVRDMDAWKEQHDTPSPRPAQPQPYSRLRKRNERRARIAQMLEARRKRFSDIERIVQLQRERKVRHGR